MRNNGVFTSNVQQEKQKIKTFKYERQRLKICEKRDKNKGETQSSLSGTVMSNVLTGRKILNSPLSLYNTVCQCCKKIYTIYFLPGVS